MSMKEQMEAEMQEMIRTLEKANGALGRIFNVEEEENEPCTRCGQEVESDTLVSYGDWKLCELCQGDI